MRLALLILVMVAVASFPFLSQLISKKPLLEDKDEMNKIIEEYINSNPQKILTSVQKYQQREIESGMEKKYQALVSANAAKLYDKNYPYVGSEADDAIMIVEFSNYLCSHCRLMKDNVEKFIAEFAGTNNSKVRYIFRTLYYPHNESSMLATKIALAANKVDRSKFLAFHSALLSYEGAYNEDSLLDLAASIGIDKVRLAETVRDDEIEEMLKASMNLAMDIEINGTPTMLVGEKVLVGSQSYENLVAVTELK